ncbi:PKD domain-containing protein [Myxococcota bacterium]|nr:PKD domain-containing protein [Myxococcota bacterium]
MRTVRVRATNTFGSTATAEATLTWFNVAPVVAAGADVTLSPGGTLTRTVTVTDPGADVLEVLIDFADGRPLERHAVLADGTVSFTRTFTTVGDSVITVIGRDDDRASGLDTFVVHVAGPMICPVGTADCDGDAANGCESTSTTCVPPLPVGCSVPTIAAASHGTVDGQGDRDGGARPVTLMFDGDPLTRARYRVGGTQAFVINVSFASPVDLDSVRTYTPIGMNTGFAGMRIETNDGAGFVERYLDTRMFGVVGRFASSTYLGGRDYPAGYVGVAGVVDHVFPGGMARGVRNVRYTVGWVDEISPDFPGGGDAVYSISEMWFCNSGAEPPAPPVAISVESGADVAIGEGEALAVEGRVTAPAGTTLAGSVYWGDGVLGEPSAFAEPLALTPGATPSTFTYELDHVFTDEGVFPVIVSVTDPATGSWSDLLLVTVENRAPVVTLASATSGNAGLALTLSGTAIDPGGDPFSLVIDWGDGQTTTAAPIGGAFSASHTYVADGTYTARVTADDGQGGVVVATTDIVVSPCAAGLGDCNGTMVDGCESTLDRVESCGACGLVCSAGANATASCTAGQCGTACLAGYQDCDGDAATGCESSAASDAANCGACGNTCAAGANAAPSCQAGQCALACLAGYSNCDGDASNGCETEGSCPCVAPQVDCDGDPGNGCETDLLTDADSCGQCGLACSYAGASGVCSGGACALGACNAGFADCDAQPANGCEVVIASDAQNCGACGHVCPSGRSCEAGRCLSPLPEVCDGIDNDEDGDTDEGLSVACNTLCGAGTMTCVAGRWSACSAAQPRAESCNGRDDDCDGEIDDGIFPACAIASCTSPNGAVPSVSITSPAADAIIGAAIDVVGTISDTDLDSWILEVLPAGATEWVTLRTGTEVVTNGVLGRLSPALHPAGIAQLRVRAIDCSGTGPAIVVPVRLEGDRLPGALRISFEDVAMELGGVPVQVMRTYDSRVRGERGDFGQGWTMEVNTKTRMARNVALGRAWNVSCSFFGTSRATELQSHVVDVRLGEQRFRFRPVVTGLGIIGGGCFGTMSYEWIGGTGRARLVGDIPVIHLNSMPGDLRYDDGEYEIVDIEPAELRTPDGKRYLLTRTGRLQQMSDPFGNHVVVGTNAISHSSGASLGLDRDPQGRVTRITDPTGAALHYAYSAAGDLTRFTDRAGRVTTFSYPFDHLLERIEDADGHTPMRVEYDEDGRIASSYDGNQAGRSLVYDDLAGTVTTTDPMGAEDALSFTASGELASAEVGGSSAAMGYDAEGRVTRLERAGGIVDVAYDANGNVTREVDASGAVTTHALTYSGDAIVTKVTTGPSGAVTRLEYTPTGLLTRKVTPTGLVETMAYDAHGLMTAKTTADGANVTAESWAYDALGRQTQHVDALGRAESVGFDALGRRTATTRTFTPAGSSTPVTVSTSLALDPNGKVTQTIDPLGRAASRALDASGRATTMTLATGETLGFAYDPAGRMTADSKPATPEFPDGLSFAKVTRDDGQLAETIDEAGVRWVYGYDAEGRRTSVSAAGEAPPKVVGYDASGRITRETHANGAVVTYAYDVAGRITAESSIEGTLHRAYDAAGRVTSLVDPSGAEHRTEYDAAGRVTRLVSPDGTSTSKTYDAQGRVLTETDEAGHVVTSAYDAVGRLTRKTDELGRGWTFGYDELDQLTRMTDPLGRARTWVRGAAGQVLQEIAPSGATIGYGYDAAGRLTRRTNADGSWVAYAHDAYGSITRQTASSGEVYTFERTATGKRASMTGADGTRVLRYDAKGNITQVDLEDGTSVAYTYDASGLKTSRTWGGATETWHYDAAQRLTRMTDATGTFDYEYDALGAPTRLVRPNGVTTVWARDPRGRVTSVAHTHGGALLASFTYGYDARGLLTRETRTEPTGVVTTDYGHDARRRITMERRSEGASVETTTFGYDAVGNRTEQTDASGTTVLAYDADDRLVQAGATTYEYDLAGRLTRETSPSSLRLYAWNADGRLVSATVDGVTETYVYDADGLRLATTRGGDVERKIWDAVGEANANLVGTRRAASDVRYGRGLELVSVGAPTGASYPLTNGHGDVTGSTSPAGELVASYEYSAYGVARGASPALGYRGEERDEATGLTYLRARYYDPATGRFLSPDDIAVLPTDLRTIHRYAYAEGSPLFYRDPSGHFLALGLTWTSGSILATLLAIWGVAYTDPTLITTPIAKQRAASDLEYQRTLTPPQFAGAPAAVNSDLAEIHFWNLSYVLPRVQPFTAGGRAGWFGNSAFERQKCYCVAANTAKILPGAVNPFITGRLGNGILQTRQPDPILGISRSEHTWNKFTLAYGGGSTEVYVDNWENFAPPIRAQAPMIVDATKPAGEFDFNTFPECR